MPSSLPSCLSVSVYCRILLAAPPPIALPYLSSALPFSATLTTPPALINSVKGRVHCTKKSADVLRRQAGGMIIEDRGELEIKGKGKMHTCWINGEDEGVTKQKADKAGNAANLFYGVTAFKTANNRFRTLRTPKRLSLRLDKAVGNSTMVTMLQGRYRAKMQALSAFTGMHRAQTARRSTIVAAARNSISSA